MRRRTFLKTSALTAGGLISTAPFREGFAAAPAGDLRPNILWLTCEDLSPRLGCYDDHTVSTPHLDRLAREGVVYTKAFATSGVCAPNRHTLIMGMYPTSTYALHMRNQSRTGALDEIVDPATRDFATKRPLYEAVPPAGARCLTEHLRLAGYYCSNNAKEDYQFRPPVTAWDASSRQAHWRNRRPGQPFFSVFNYMVTHESGVFGDGNSPKKVNPDSVALPPYYPDTPAVRADVAKHYDNIAALDAQIGDKIAELAADGLLDKTIIFFFSDHGDGLPRAKRWVYDSGTHVPLIVRWPHGKNAGTRCDRLVSFVDFGPTILSLAGVAQPDLIHGIPFLGAQAGPEREYVYCHRDRNGENRETIRSVRDGRYRYVRNYRPQDAYIRPLAYRDRQAIMQDINRAIATDALSGEQWQLWAKAKPLEEFYDTEVDPFEIHNLAADPRHYRDMARMRQALDSWITLCNDPLDMPEEELVRQRVYPPDGRQPSTADPVVQVHTINGGKIKITVDCPTQGASIGFRPVGNGPWSIYDGPVEWEATDGIEILAHRIGFKPSAKVVVRVPQA